MPSNSPGIANHSHMGSKPNIIILFQWSAGKTEPSEKPSFAHVNGLTHFHALAFNGEPDPCHNSTRELLAIIDIFKTKNEFNVETPSQSGSHHDARLVTAFKRQTTGRRRRPGRE